MPESWRLVVVFSLQYRFFSYVYYRQIYNKKSELPNNLVLFCVSRIYLYDNGPRSIPLQEPFLLFHASHFPCHANTSIHAMQLVTPSAVAMADSTLMAVWIANFQNVLFFMVIYI